MVGQNLVELLVNNNISVNYLTTSSKKIVQKQNYSGFYWNPKTAEIDPNCLEDVEAIIHLAGANIGKRWTKAYKAEILDSRILSTNLLFELLKNNKNQVKQMISASGTAIYPDSTEMVYDENFSAKPNGFLSTVVQEWEKKATAISSLGIKVCKLRTGVVYANDGGALQEIIKPIKYGFGASFGTGKQMHSWIHIQDLVKIYVFALKNNLEGTFNAVAPNPTSDEELTKSIAKILKKPLFLPNIPRFVMKLVLGEMHELLFEDKKISSKKIISQGYEFQFPTIESALKEIFLPKN